MTPRGRLVPARAGPFPVVALGSLPVRVNRRDRGCGRPDTLVPHQYPQGVHWCGRAPPAPSRTATGGASLLVAAWFGPWRRYGWRDFRRGSTRAPETERPTLSDGDANSPVHSRATIGELLPARRYRSSPARRDGEWALLREAGESASGHSSAAGIPRLCWSESVDCSRAASRCA